MLPEDQVPAAPDPPHILVADDTPVSVRFLADAFGRLGAQVRIAFDGPQALAIARRARFDLLVLDCRMPGAGAVEILDALRGNPQAASRLSPAVATSAELRPHDEATLRNRGFAGILHKPCTLDDLRQVLALIVPAAPAEPLLDDAKARATSGSDAIAGALRGLMAQELVALDRDLAALTADPNALAERLHRLRASCGFCGATALSAAIEILERQLRGGHHLGSLERFRDVLRQTLAALQAGPAAAAR